MTATGDPAKVTIWALYNVVLAHSTPDRLKDVLDRFVIDLLFEDSELRILLVSSTPYERIVIGF